MGSSEGKRRGPASVCQFVSQADTSTAIRHAPSPTSAFVHKRTYAKRARRQGISSRASRTPELPGGRHQPRNESEEEKQATARLRYRRSGARIKPDCYQSRVGQAEKRVLRITETDGNHSSLRRANPCRCLDISRGIKKEGNGEHANQRKWDGKPKRPVKELHLAPKHISARARMSALGRKRTLASPRRAGRSNVRYRPEADVGGNWLRGHLRRTKPSPGRLTDVSSSPFSESLKCSVAIHVSPSPERCRIRAIS